MTCNAQKHMREARASLNIIVVVVPVEMASSSNSNTQVEAKLSRLRSWKRKRAPLDNLYFRSLYPFRVREDGTLGPGGGHFKRLITRDHLDCFPRTVLHAQLAPNTNIEIDLNEFLVLVEVGPGHGEDAIHGTELNAYFTSGAARLVYDRQFSWPLLSL